MKAAAAVLARYPLVAGGVLLAAFAAQAAVSACLDSVTFDETAHLGSGYAALDRNDYRMNPEHPALPKMICALPLWLLEAREDLYETPAWRDGQQWRFGDAFLNRPGGWSPRARLICGRLPMILLGVLLGVLVFAWAKDLWGTPGALTALLLYALSPTLLAHAHLVTTDLPAAFGFALCLWCFARFCRRPGIGRGAAAAGSLGIALLMKFSMILLLPLLPAGLLAWVLAPSDPPLDRRRKAWLAGALTAAAGAASVLAVWTTYGFRYSIGSEPGATAYWPAAELDGGLLAGAVSLARRFELLPEGYLFGLSYVVKNSQRISFLNGAVLTEPSRLYLAEAFLLKSTPATLILAALGAWSWSRRPEGAGEKVWVMLPACFYFVSSLAFGMTLGQRHLSPMYPLLFVTAGAVAAPAAAGPRWRAALLALLASHAVSSLASFPRPLAYFNVAAGGSSGGWRYLVDSNIDWGQDLRRLGDWMARAGVPTIHLAYFGTGDPENEGVPYRKVYRFMDLSSEHPATLPGPGDTLAVSVTLLQGLYCSDPEVRALLDAVRTRLTPIGKAGDSIFIYRIPAGEDWRGRP